ncbi:MAG: outer membrane protein [Dokdonia sp.]|jgi:outer membrane protein
MKSLKSILILSLLLYSFVGLSQSDDDTSTAPTAKGNFVVGGSSNFNFSSSTPKTRRSKGTDDDGIRSTRFSFTPNLGYFVIDNLAVGGGVSFTSGRTKSNELDFDSRNTRTIFSVFSLYYFTEGNIKPFLQGSVGLGFSNSKNEMNSIESESKSSIFNYGFNGGVAFFIGKSFSVDLGAGYTSSSVKPKDANFRFINKGIGFDVGFNL